jgi:hypothetical protein
MNLVRTLVDNMDCGFNAVQRIRMPEYMRGTFD